MNNLLLFMTLCGSISLIVYYLLRLLFRERLIPVYRYWLLKMTITFFLLPIPLLTYDVRNIVRLIFQNEDLFSLQIQPGDVLREDLSKIYYLTEKGVVLPRYSRIFFLFFSVWLLILSIFIITQLYKYKKLKRIILYTSAKLDPSDILLDDKYEKLIQKRHVNFRVSSDNRSSFTYGLLHPVIVISDAAGSDERKYIIKHELTHVKSLDFITRILCLLTVALHFYNPLAYLLFHEINNVSELQCDEKMLKNATMDERVKYGHLVIESACPSSKAYIVTPFSGQNKKILKERVMMIKKEHSRKGIVFAMSFILLLSTGTLPVLAYDPPTLQTDESEEVIGIDFIETSLVGNPFPEDEITFKNADSYFIAEDGQIIIENNISSHKNCAHIFKHVENKTHKKNKTGGCTVKSYTCSKCTRCNAVKNKNLVSETTYKKCPH